MRDGATHAIDDVSQRLIHYGYARDVSRRVDPLTANPRRKVLGKVALTPAGEQVAQRLARGASYVYFPHQPRAGDTDVQSTVWTAMRIRPTFSVRQLLGLLIDADLKPHVARGRAAEMVEFFNQCRRRGLLTRLRFIAGDGAVYRLAHNIGPIAPVFTGSATWCGNTNAFWWQINAAGEGSA